MLPELFSDDAYIALSTQKLLDSVLQNEQLKHEIERIVQDHFEEKLRSLSDSDNEEEGEKIIQAAETVHSPVTEKLSQYQRALNSERLGFEYLIEGEYEKAIEAFNEAERTYNGFHEVYHIATLLKKNLPIDSDKRKNILEIIVNKRSWKAPKDLLDKIRQEASR